MTDGKSFECWSIKDNHGADKIWRGLFHSCTEAAEKRKRAQRTSIKISGNIAALRKADSVNGVNQILGEGEVSVQIAQRIVRENSISSIAQYVAELELLPSFLRACRLSDPSGRYFLDTIVGKVASESIRQFKRMFVSFGMWQRVFEDHGSMTPVLAIDASHMRTIFGGVCIAAVGVDANGKICPLAIAISQSEDTSGVLWFLQTLQTLLGDKKFVMVTDQGSALTSNDVESWITDNGHSHAFCVKHLWDFVKKKFRGKLAGVENLLLTIAAQRVKARALSFVEDLRQINADVATYVTERLDRICAFSHLEKGFFRGGRVTSQLVESFFSVAITFRSLGPISGIMQLHDHYGKTFKARQSKIEKHENRADAGPLMRHATPFFEVPVSESLRGASTTDLEPVLLKGQCTATEATATVAAFWDSSKEPVKVSVVMNLIEEKYSCTCKCLEETGVPCRHIVLVVITFATNHRNTCSNGKCSEKCYTSIWKDFLNSEKLLSVVVRFTTWRQQYDFVGKTVDMLVPPTDLPNGVESAVSFISSTMEKHNRLSLYPWNIVPSPGRPKGRKKRKTRVHAARHDRIPSVVESKKKYHVHEKELNLLAEELIEGGAFRDPDSTSLDETPSPLQVEELPPRGIEENVIADPVVEDDHVDEPIQMEEEEQFAISNVSMSKALDSLKEQDACSRLSLPLIR